MDLDRENLSEEFGMDFRLEPDDSLPQTSDVDVCNPNAIMENNIVMFPYHLCNTKSMLGFNLWWEQNKHKTILILDIEGDKDFSTDLMRKVLGSICQK